MGQPPRIRIGALTIVAARPRELGRFYSRFLNWPYLREEEPAPGDPPDAGEQVPTMHLDVGVDDLDAAVAWGIECGASVPEFQPRPSQHRVVIDPEGHPLCRCLP